MLLAILAHDGSLDCLENVLLGGQSGPQGLVRKTESCRSEYHEWEEVCVRARLRKYDSQAFPCFS